MHHSSIGKGPSMIIPLPPRDLADFHLRWSDFRPAMEQLRQMPALSPEQAEILGWLIALSDRISDADIAP